MVEKPFLMSFPSTPNQRYCLFLKEGHFVSSLREYYEGGYSAEFDEGEDTLLAKKGLCEWN